MKKTIVLFLLILFLLKNYGQVKHIDQQMPPIALMGNFVDDYEIHYKINDTLWLQYPRTRFHIIKWNTAKQYLIARNDDHNPGEGGLYTRIDYMQLDDMAPWKWGYCLTAYSAASDSIAEATVEADRNNPMKGCNGFPFSRMKAEK